MDSPISNQLYWFCTDGDMTKILPFRKTVVFFSWRNPNSFIKNAKLTLDDSCATDKCNYLLSYSGIFSITDLFCKILIRVNILINESPFYEEWLPMMTKNRTISATRIANKIRSLVHNNCTILLFISNKYTKYILSQIYLSY